MSEEKPKKVYKKAGPNDKRKETSKANLKKAREMKIKQLKEEKEVYDESSDSDSSSSDNEHEVIQIKAKKVNKNGKNKVKDVIEDPIQKQLDEMKTMIQSLSKPKKKIKSKAPRQIVKIVNPPAIKESPEMDGLKKRMLLNF